ncbi:MAG: exo-alpha-sialidase [Bacteroidota bacterium]
MNINNITFCFLFQFLFVGNQKVEISQTTNKPNSQQKQISKSNPANLIFESNDNGQSWQDISEGLPENILSDRLVSNDKELFVLTEKGIYQKPTSEFFSKWKRENFYFNQNNIVMSKDGLLTFNRNGEFFKKIYSTNLLMPIYTSFKGNSVRTIFESASGTIFIGSDEGLFKSTNNGKTWNHVHKNGWVIKIVESDGVLLATNQSGILRSTNNGEQWSLVINEGGVGIDLAVIDGGFAAITYNTTSKTRRVRTSFDGGKSWNAIDESLPAHDLISSVVQSGKYLLCGHPDGIYRSADKGKSWNLILPSIGEKVFNLSVSGNLIYAIAREGGC